MSVTRSVWTQGVELSELSMSGVMTISCVALSGGVEPGVVSWSLITAHQHQPDQMDNCVNQQIPTRHKRMFYFTLDFQLFPALVQIAVVTTL